MVVYSPLPPPGRVLFTVPPPGTVFPIPPPGSPFATTGCMWPVAPTPPIPSPGPSSGHPAPGGGRAGINYLHPKEFTLINLLERVDKPWENGPITGTSLKVTPFRVPTNYTVSYLIERLSKTDGKGLEIVEVYELQRGDGHWGKGTNIPHDSGGAKKVITEYGWTARRGASANGLEPVWAVIQKDK
ncbi:hypothetical protein LTR39_004792 [Cryomyces antarcticus]|nr:hypothetical protein LTR39_004792 [Cryomyces antarcticus]